VHGFQARLGAAASDLALRGSARPPRGGGRPKRDTSVKRCGASMTPRVPTSPLCRGDQAPPNRVKTALANIAGRARDAREHLKGENIRESECVCVYVCVMWVHVRERG